MRSKVTVVLLFLNVALFAYIYFYDKPMIDERKTVEARRRVLGAESATIESLERRTRTGEVVKLEKRLDNWWLTAPYEWPADRNAIAGLLSTLELLEHETSFAVAGLEASGRSLADYGLVEPSMTVTFKSAGKEGREYTLLVGDVTQVSNNLYLLSPDKTRIHVVSRSVAENLGLPLDILRSSSIFSVPVFEVRSLNVQTAERANLKVRVRRDANGRWNFEAPINARASKASVEVTINAVNAITARSFLEPRDTDLERAGLNAPSVQVTLEGNARRETLLLGNATGKTVARENRPEPDAEYYAKMEDNPVVFTTAVPKPLLDVLKRAQEELRDPRVADFEPAAVTSFTLVAPGQPELTLQRLEPAAPPAAGTPAPDPAAKAAPAPSPVATDGWQAVVRQSGASPQTVAADPGIVTGLLQKLSQLSAHEPPGRPGAPKFLSDAPSATDLENWGFNRPEREITLNFGAGGAPLTIQIGVSPDKPGEAFARTTHAPFVYQILPDILDETPVTARHYRHRVLRELPDSARVTAIKLSEIGAAAPLVELNNEGGITAQSLATGTFKMDHSDPAKPLSEQGRAVLTSLLTEVRRLRARAFTAGAYTPDHAETASGPQPWKYQLEIVTAFAGGAAPAPSSSTVLLLTDRLAGSTMLAGTTGFGGVVFEVTQEMLDAIFALTYTAKQDPGPPAANAVPPPATPPGEAPKSATPPAPENPNAKPPTPNK